MKMKSPFLIFFFGLLTTFLSQISFARNPGWQLTVGGKVVVYDASLNKNIPASPCKVSLFKDDVLVKEIVNPAHGEFSFLLDPDHEYVIAAQNDGYIKQQVIISTKDVPDDSWKHFRSLDLQMVIFKTYPDYDYSFTEKPLVRFCYNYTEDDFDYDSEYEMAMRVNANKMQALSDIAVNHQVFQIDIAKGDSLFKMEKWEDAKALYQDASKKLFHENYPKDQIKLCDQKLQEKQKEQEKKDSAYSALLVKADAKFAAKKYTDAKTIYQQASAIHPEMMYPKSQMQECDRAINGGPDYEKNKAYNDSIFSADGYFDGKDYLNAKKEYTAASKIKPAEQYPKDMIKKCEDFLSRNDQFGDDSYSTLIKSADAKFAAKDYAGAKYTYQQASNKKPTEQYPKDQIAKCDKLIADTSNPPHKSYNDLITDADAKFKTADWSGAKAKYAEASQLKPNEKYPKDQIAICDQQLAAIQAEAQYKDFIKQADDKFAVSDWASAKNLYSQALTLSPMEQYPADQIKICDSKAAAIESEKKYNDDISQGDALFKKKDWPNAKLKYVDASKLKPNEQYPKDQIGICDQAIANGW